MTCCDILDILKCRKLSLLHFDIDLIYTKCVTCPFHEFSAEVDNIFDKQGKILETKHQENVLLSCLHLWEIDFDNVNLIPLFEKSLKRISFKKLPKKFQELEDFEYILKKCCHLQEIGFPNFTAIFKENDDLQNKLMEIFTKYQFVIDNQLSNSQLNINSRTKVRSWSGCLYLFKVHKILNVTRFVFKKN